MTRQDTKIPAQPGEAASPDKPGEQGKPGEAAASPNGAEETGAAPHRVDAARQDEPGEATPLVETDEAALQDEPPPASGPEDAATKARFELKARLADTLRAILDRLPLSGADEALLSELEAPLLGVAERLTRAGLMPRASAANVIGRGHYAWVGPVAGRANAIAPPFSLWVDEAEKAAFGRGSFRKMHEGAPGVVHGGLLSAVIDELLGRATMLSGGPGMTARLSVRYLQPTPIQQPLELKGWIERTSGRRLFMKCEVRCGEVMTARAEGLFIRVPKELFRELERKQRELES